MKRTPLSIFFIVALVASFASSAFASKVGYFYGFDKEKTVEPWSASIDGVPAPSVGSDQDVLSLGKDSTGNLYAALNNHGAKGAWMQAAFKPSDNIMHIDFDIKDVSHAKRLAAIIYVGNKKPANVYEFEKLGMPLGDGPQHLEYTVSLKEMGLASGPVVVAMGTFNLDDITSDQVAGLDNISITISDH